MGSSSILRVVTKGVCFAGLCANYTGDKEQTRCSDRTPARHQTTEKVRAVLANLCCISDFNPQ